MTEKRMRKEEKVIEEKGLKEWAGGGRNESRVQPSISSILYFHNVMINRVTLFIIVVRCEQKYFFTFDIVVD